MQLNIVFLRTPQLCYSAPLDFLFVFLCFFLLLVAFSIPNPESTSELSSTKECRNVQLKYFPYRLHAIIISRYSCTVLNEYHPLKVFKKIIYLPSLAFPFSWLLFSTCLSFFFFFGDSSLAGSAISLVSFGTCSPESADILLFLCRFFVFFRSTLQVNTQMRKFKKKSNLSRLFCDFLLYKVNSKLDIGSFSKLTLLPRSKHSYIYDIILCFNWSI